MESLCLIITLLIFSAYYVFLSSQRPAGILYKVLTSSVFTCAQIILSELIFGLFHHLYLPSLVTVNLFIAGAMYLIGRRDAPRRTALSLNKEIHLVGKAAGAAMDWYGMILVVIAVFAYGWILAAAYFLPPRGIDDNAYHLPAIFEYVQSHEIRLLADVGWSYAFPQNAELLFMWPVLFTHSQRWLSGMNVPFVLLSLMTIYALLRYFNVREKDAVFAALLYALCPVVLMLAGVNYVDIIVSLFLLLGLYYSILYYEHGQLQDLVAAGLVVGLLCGMKYTALVLVLPLQVLIVPRLWKDKGRHMIGYVAVITFAGGWWYIRNAFLLGDPLHPMHILASMPRVERGTQGGTIIQNILYNVPYWITRYPLADSGVGKYDGGFGLVFWGMGFLSWLYVTTQALFTFGRTRLPVFVMLAYLPVGFLLLLMMPPQWIDINGRFSLFVVFVGLFALCDVLRLLQDQRLISIIKILCIALSVITVSLMSVSNRPSYRLAHAVSDAISHVEASEYKYLADSIPVHAMLRPAWEVLDLLTRDNTSGLNCAMVSTPDNDIFLPAPVYGSRLQNRVLNMGAKAPADVDAYVCTYMGRNKLDVPAPVIQAEKKPMLSVREIIEKDGYVAVVQTEHVCLMLRESIFNRKDLQNILKTYYRNTWPEAAVLADEMGRNLDPDIPLITSSDVGYGMRIYDMNRSHANRVYLAFENREQEIAARLNAAQYYTLTRPLPGYRPQKVMHEIYRGKGIDIYLNSKL